MLAEFEDDPRLGAALEHDLLLYARAEQLFERQLAAFASMNKNRRDNRE